MEGASLLFFFAFAVVVVLTYLGIRRHWAKPSTVAAVGVSGSIIMMVLSMITQPLVQPLYAVVAGIVLGGLLSGAALAAAWYFETNEMRARSREQQAGDN